MSSVWNTFFLFLGNNDRALCISRCKRNRTVYLSSQCKYIFMFVCIIVSVCYCVNEYKMGPFRALFCAQISSWNSIFTPPGDPFSPLQFEMSIHLYFTDKPHNVWTGQLCHTNVWLINNFGASLKGSTYGSHQKWPASHIIHGTRPLKCRSLKLTTSTPTFR